MQGSRETTIHEVASEISNLEGVKTTEMQLSHNGKILWDGPRYEIDDEYLHCYLSEVSRDTTVVEDEILTNRCHRSYKHQSYSSYGHRRGAVLVYNELPPPPGRDRKWKPKRPVPKQGTLVPKFAMDYTRWKRSVDV